MTTSLNIPAADFSSVRASLQTFLSGQNKFADFNFAGSNISALVDVLAYNTYIGNFYDNMAVNESFRDSAKLRTNVAARAQENGYVPRSFTSATAVVNFAITSNNVTRSNVVIAKGTPITARVDNRNFTFVTLQPAVTSVSSQTSNSITFVASGVVVAEGFNVGDSYVVDSSTDLLEITNAQVDISSLNVTVIEDQINATTYSRAETVIGVDSTTNAFFVRVAPTGNYAIHFGDGITGNRPKNGAVVIIEYRVSNGQLPNGASVFLPGQGIDGESNVVITTVDPALGGDIYEDIESIRFNGQQANVRQQRSVYDDDYENDIKTHFTYLADISVVGGEDVYPPQFGRIIITAVATNYTNLSTRQTEDIRAFVTSRSPMTTRPVFQQANIIRLGVTTTLSLDGSKTFAQIKPIVASALDNFNTKYLGKFKRSAIRSKISSAIDNSDPSIIGNNTTLTMIIPVNTNTASTLTFGNAITSVTSAAFSYKGITSRVININDQLYVINNQTGVVVSNVGVGTVDFTNGIVSINIDEPFIQRVDIAVTPTNADILSAGSSIVKIAQSDIVIK